MSCTDGYNSQAYNLYLPLGQERIVLGQATLTILDVSPGRLGLSISR